MTACSDDVGKTSGLGIGVTRAVSVHIRKRYGMRLSLAIFSLMRRDAAGDYSGPVRADKIDCTCFWTATSRAALYR
jgi:hypothetical protein